MTYNHFLVWLLCAALEQLFQAYFPVSEKGPTERLRTRVLEKFIRTLNTSKNPAATRGYALALEYRSSNGKVRNSYLSLELYHSMSKHPSNRYFSRFLDVSLSNVVSLIQYECTQQRPNV